MRKHRVALAGLVSIASLTVALGEHITPVSAGSADLTALKPRPAPTNKMGVRIVTFDKNVTRAQMFARVKAAGGRVVTDLSKLHRLAVVPAAGTFDRKIDAAPGVNDSQLDRMIRLDLPDGLARAKAYSSKLRAKHDTRVRPDPLHDVDSFLDENAPGVLQWDDDATGARRAWRKTRGDRSVRVAVLDTGAQFNHRELAPVINRSLSGSTVPCKFEFQGTVYDLDCEPDDLEGHGTWVSSRIAGALNDFASNGAAPGVQVMSIKVLSAVAGGGLTSWIVAGMVKACDADADVINMSLGGYDALGTDDEDLQMWIDAVNYCRAKGTAIIASAGNEHVRVHRRTLSVNGRRVRGLGQVDTGRQGISTIIPGGTLASADLRGLILVPAGVPGVIMVSSSNNANGAPSGYSLPGRYDHPTVGRRDQLAYYSNYGSRVDIGAPGGARKIGIPRYDGGDDDVLYGGWGQVGALAKGGETCTDPNSASLLAFACFTIDGQQFGWLQGTSMAAPNATGVAALWMSARHRLQGRPNELLAVLRNTARRPAHPNETGPNNPSNTAASFFGTPCPTGYCHLDYGRGLISNRDAFGAGLASAAAIR